MGWDDAEKAASESSGGKFIRLKEGDDAVVGMFLDAPAVKSQFWTGTEYVQFDPVAHKGQKLNYQYSMNFFDLKSGEMKIMQGGTALYIALREIRDEYGLSGCVYKVSRSGKKSDTRFSMLIQPKAEVPETFPAIHNLDEFADSYSTSAAVEGTSERMPLPDEPPY